MKRPRLSDLVNYKSRNVLRVRGWTEIHGKPQRKGRPAPRACVSVSESVRRGVPASQDSMAIHIQDAVLPPCLITQPHNTQDKTDRDKRKNGKSTVTGGDCNTAIETTNEGNSKVR